MKIVKILKIFSKWCNLLLFLTMDQENLENIFVENAWKKYCNIVHKILLCNISLTYLEVNTLKFVEKYALVYNKKNIGLC